MLDSAKCAAELKLAKRLFRRKKFSKVVKSLEKDSASLSREYADFERDSKFALAAEWFYVLGVSCMYLGDIGSATEYLVKARKISRENDILVNEVLTAQAAIFLRRGNTAKAIEIYLEILASDPKNATAKKAMDFLKNSATDEAISRIVANGKIKKFYPNPGFYFPVLPVALALAACACIAFVAYAVKIEMPSAEGKRANLAELGISLSPSDKKSMLESDVSARAFSYLLTESEVEKLFLLAQDDFQRYRDNSARTKINKILNSNATGEIQRKARLLAAQLDFPDFEGLRGSRENFSAAEVKAEPILFDGCAVVWRGRAANFVQEDDGASCLFLVGYEDLKDIEARVELRMSGSVSLDPSRSFEVLAKIRSQNGEFFLEAVSFFQPRDFK